MFKLSYTEPAEIAGIIDYTGKNYPGLGPMTDTCGNRWDIRGIFGSKDEMIVQACPISSLHPYFYDTSGQYYTGFISQRWEPYILNWIKDDKTSSS